MVSKGKKSMLDLGDSDSDEGKGLNINKNYAERYDKWRGNEELQKLKDRYGDLGKDDDDESSSSSSEEEWTAEKEKAFFKTFSLLKKKDPKIYDEKVHFFKDMENTEQGSSQQQAAASSSSASKQERKKMKQPVFLIKDHERKMILEHGGLSDGEREDDEEDDDERERKKIRLNLRKGEPTYVQEQESIKKGFSDALKNIDSDDEGDDYQKSDLLKKRKKTVKETEAEEESYRKWLRGEVDKLNDEDKNVSGELEYLRNYWSNESELPEGEKFLRDYILDRKYKEPEDKNIVPSYDEIVHDSDEAGLSGDEEEVNKMEEFEHKYNFRFEEPDQEFIKKYPRTIESSLRRADEKRKRHREAAKDRKEFEKSKKREEIARLKALKRAEILEKIKQIEEITGDETTGTKFCDEDLEGDFDPAEHDRVMKQIFNEEYYDVGDEEKPVFPFDEELDSEDLKPYVPSDNENGDEDNYDEMEEEDENGNGADTGEASMQQEEKRKKEIKTKKTSTFIDELIEASKGKRQSKKKKSSIFLQALERNKPKFDGSKPFEEYFDEYYKLDFEDLIGDLPCRFKYRKVTPNDFGLDINEILLAPDRELNQWASLKKTYQYRSAEEEKYDLDAYKKKAANDKQKKRVLGSFFNEGKDDDDDTGSENEPEQNPSVENGDSKKKRKKKNKKKKKKSTQKDEIPVENDNECETKVKNEDISVHDSSAVGESETKKKKKKNRLNSQSDTTIASESPSTVLENESKNETNSLIPPHDEKNKLNETTKKDKKKKKKNNKLAQTPNEENDSSPDLHNQNINVQSVETVYVQNGGKKRKFVETPVNGGEDDNNKYNTSNKNRNKNKKTKQDINSNKAKSTTNKNSNNSLELDDDRLRAYSINPTKYKKQLKYGKKS